MDSFLELARVRRSYRKYTEEPLKQEQIEQILQAALMSPASKRCNPWEFVVVTDRETLNKMAGCRTYGSQMLTESAAGIIVNACIARLGTEYISANSLQLTAWTKRTPSQPNNRYAV